MSKAVLDADELLQHASPVVHQTGHEIQPYGHLIRMPIALAESACKESVDNLNQLLADTMTLRDLYKKHHWHVSGPTFYQPSFRGLPKAASRFRSKSHDCSTRMKSCSRRLAQWRGSRPSMGMRALMMCW